MVTPPYTSRGTVVSFAPDVRTPPDWKAIRRALRATANTKRFRPMRDVLEPFGMTIGHVREQEPALYRAAVDRGQCVWLIERRAGLATVWLRLPTEAATIS